MTVPGKQGRAPAPGNGQRCLWEKLHQEPRHLLRYPNEDVIRFVAGEVAPRVRRNPNARVLDLGCGAGRHLTLLEDFGIDGRFGCDFSLPGVAATAERQPGAGLTVADMRSLPFRDRSFEAVIAFGVLYYGDRAAARAAFAEIYRVLAPGGVAYVLVKAAGDRRSGGLASRVVSAGPEAGMTLSFFDLDELEALASPFAGARIEASWRTEGGCAEVDASWHLYLTR